MRTILLVPGYTNSGLGHWQTLWEGQMPSWEHPRRPAWVEALLRELM